LSLTIRCEKSPFAFLCTPSRVSTQLQLARSYRLLTLQRQEATNPRRHIMKRTNKALIAVLAGSLLLGGAGAALAFGGPGKGGCDRSGMMSMRAIPQLDNLTDEQRNQLDTLRKDQRDAMRKQRDTMSDARDELHAAMSKGADIATIRKLAEKQGAQVATMIVARAEMQQKLEAILTPEQRAQFKEKTGQRFGDGMGHPRHGW